MGKPRGRVIDEDVLEVVLHILDTWTGKLTWDALIASIKASIATEYTRQALSKHERIATAFGLRKVSLEQEQGRPTSGDARVNALLETISTLKAQNARLNVECEQHRAMFIRWTHNAQMKNLTFEQLDAPLSPVHRGATEEKVIRLGKGNLGKGKNGK